MQTQPTISKKTTSPYRIYILKLIFIYLYYKLIYTTFINRLYFKGENYSDISYGYMVSDEDEKFIVARDMKS